MTSPATDEADRLERSVRASTDQGDLAGAVDKTLREYGRELFGFLVGVLGDEQAATRVYGELTQELHREFLNLRWRTELRTWTYGCARRAIRREDQTTNGRSRLPSPVFVDVSATVPFRRPAHPDALGRVRARLSRYERELLILRVDRRFSWRQLAVTSLGETASERRLADESARLRRHFHDLRVRLARIAYDEGFVLR